MEIGIIHFTDLHLKEDKNWIDENVNSIVVALKTDFDNVKNIFIIISGDIVDKGKGYISAENFLTKLTKSLERFVAHASFEFIMVPGNHDCNFNEKNQVRDILIQNIQSTPLEDDSVVNTCLFVQNDFWSFYKKIVGSVPTNKLAYQITREIEGRTISFNCYNTAWMSSIDEVTGKLFFPINKISDVFTQHGNHLTFSIFHHPLSWFTPNTEPNNKKEFSNHLEKTSQIIIYGHEHENVLIKNENINTSKETIYVSGTPLQSDILKNSGFKTIIIDVVNKVGTIKEYKWSNKESLFVGSTNNFTINHSKHIEKTFIPKNDFLDKINTLNLPLKFENRKNVRQSDIFVYPDLEKLSIKEKRIDEVYSSEKLLTEGGSIVVLEGESQSGKTTLLNMLYIDFLDNSKYPIFIEAKALLKYSEKALRKCFEEQYEGVNFDAFLQFNKEDKVLLIDNLQDFNNNAATLISVIENLQKIFNRIIIGATSTFEFSSSLNARFDKINYYFIQPLGYKKRNELIEKYHILNESPQTITEQVILEKTKYHFEQIQTVLGNKLIPSYPVYVLSILQTLIYATPHNLEQTSMGYCYQSLIYVALTDKAKVKNTNIDSYFNFLSELAFNLYQTNSETFNEKYLNDFYSLYSSRYITDSLSKITNNLLLSNIIMLDEDGDYKFRYNYILYFLIARKIVELINTTDGKNIIKSLCDNLSDEKSANILIFTTHHTKDSYLIDETTLSLMTPYDGYAPLTLLKDDVFYNEIEQLVKDISSNIISANKSPREEREKRLEASDKLNKKFEKIENNKSHEDLDHLEKDDSEKATELLEEMSHALKSIEIVGQIVKNRKGSIDKLKLEEIIAELYNTAFRTISFFSEITKFTQDELIDSLKEKVNENDSRTDIENKIKKFFQYITFQHCLGIFSKVIFNVGSKDLTDIFEKVANEINTPASKLVTFSIKTVYGKLSQKELKELVKEFEGNPVALSILKARVRAYIYNNVIDYKDKQKIASILNMKLLN